MASMRGTLHDLALLALLCNIALSATPASFTWNNGCLPDHKPACGDAFRTTAIGGGYAATNRANYQSAEGGCGSCWLLTPQSNPNPSNGNKFGGPVTVMINDECSDGGYCDQRPSADGKSFLNTKYQKALHFDLCTFTSAAEDFFGNLRHFGQLMGTAEKVECGENGTTTAPITTTTAAAAAAGGTEGEGEGQGEGQDQGETNLTGAEVNPVRQPGDGESNGTEIAAGGTDPVGSDTVGSDPVGSDTKGSDTVGNKFHSSLAQQDFTTDECIAA